MALFDTPNPVATNQKHTGFDLRRALRAVSALINDPDDTAQAFRVVDALAGRAPERNLRRFAATAVGARVLGERRSLMALLSDRARLEALPEDSLGRAYLRFMDAEGISADGLVEASVVGAGREVPSDPTELELFDSWMRDSHDVWHTVTGYGGDLIGEASLLAFSFAQTGHPGVGLIVVAALLRTTFLGRVLRPGDPPALDVDPAQVRRMIVDGYRRGRRARWMPAQDWEALLAEPLDVVRQRVGVGDAPRYTPLRANDIAVAA
jgi:ubiquinone biosynthesis protein COQ4